MLRRTIHFNLALLLLLLTGSAAQAHADFVSSNPSDGSVVQSFPSEISLTFNEELLTLDDESVNTISLFGPDEIEISLSSAEANGANLVATVAGDAAALPAGKYRVSYRAVSADGHPVKGEFSFEVAPLEEITTTQVTPTPTPTPLTQSDLGAIAPFLAIILIIGAVLLIRKKR
jgi:methionine-rich copper-binding protein CopC